MAGDAQPMGVGRADCTAADQWRLNTNRWPGAQWGQQFACSLTLYHGPQLVHLASDPACIQDVSVLVHLGAGCRRLHPSNTNTSLPTVSNFRGAARVVEGSQCMWADQTWTSGSEEPTVTQNTK